MEPNTTEVAKADAEANQIKEQEVAGKVEEEGGGAGVADEEVAPKASTDDSSNLNNVECNNPSTLLCM